MKNLIQKHDSQNQFQILVDSHKQIKYAWKDQIEIVKELAEDIDNIIVAGMGGSAISANLLKCFLNDELKVPLNLVSDYTLPAFANNRTLLIISSYSGNTEETISCFKDGIKKGCKIVSLSTGGLSHDLASDHNLFWLKLQDGFQPRFALGVSFFSLLKILQSLKFIPEQDEYVEKIVSLWERRGKEYSLDGNAAQNYAGALIGFIPIIYTSARFEPVGYRLKCQFNENSKLLSFNNIYPELNHNEIVGWESFSDKQLNAKIISIIDNEYHPQIQKRIKITNELASNKGVEIITLKSNEENIKVRIMDLIYLGDWITYYLSIMRAFDPSEIDYILEMKQRLT